MILDFPGEGSSPCPLFLGRYVRGVRNCESPRWLKERLASVGLRPISALVDLTNFLTIDRNRPVHVFDAGKVKGDIWLRLGQGGASFAALNGKDYALDDTMTAIGDESGVISLAGVMGGEPTGCTMETTDVFIEIALFDPVRTATTGRTFNLESDARYRFERGVRSGVSCTRHGADDPPCDGNLRRQGERGGGRRCRTSVAAGDRLPPLPRQGAGRRRQ